MNSQDEPSPTLCYARVLLDVPIADAFDYLISPEHIGLVATGSWVVVPWGKRRLVGIVMVLADTTAFDPAKVRQIERVLDDAPLLPANWFELGQFVHRYYHRQPGEILVPVIPKLLRKPPSNKPGGRRVASAFARARKKLGDNAPGRGASVAPTLTSDQAQALERLGKDDGFSVTLLHGVTGSGKTEVYLQWLAQRMAQVPDGQVVLLVPEIALTPQLSQRVSERLAGTVAVLHSGMAEGERAAHWLAAVEGRARIIVGTRLSVLVPLARLAGIVVDEEHDPSFKQQESPHYSARDLAILRARQANVPVVLGSATPSLESWHAARGGRYQYLGMPTRAGGSPLPEIEIHSLRGIGKQQTSQDGVPEGLCAASFEALQQCLLRKEQALVFLNRRGYAPVLSCVNCGWLSECSNCSAYRVLHRLSAKPPRYQLICHHCATEAGIPSRCPGCGDLNLQPVGRGTQRIEEVLAEAFPQASVMRLDRDVARRRGAAGAVIDSIHQGEVDIVVGTQMLAKGHDFERLNLVVVLDADGGLFSSDFRAPERLFATLTQVAGRAGRHVRDARARVIIQTRFEEHPIFDALRGGDYASFADAQLEERRAASLPPFSYQALLRMEARTLDQAIDFGRSARQLALSLQASHEATLAALSIYDPVPMPMAMLAGKSRAQLLVESVSRSQLHQFLAMWQQGLADEAGPVRWQLEIDPAQI